MGKCPVSILALSFSVLASIVSATSESSWPLGVSPEFAKFYEDTETFSCISNPTIKFPIDRINDDYCDCPDGSDEPGTSACASLSFHSPGQPSILPDGQINKTSSLPGFYCKNKGHRSSYVPFTNVNDGICDYELCCDGSDEHARVGGIKCEDQCAKIGKEWRKQDATRQRSIDTARIRRQEMVDEAQRLHKEVEDRITTLKTQIEAQIVKVDALTKSLLEIERQERGKVIRGSGKAGKVTVLASLAKEKIRELSEGIHKVLDERDAAQARVQELEAILRKFKEEYNPNFNDEGVKRAVKAWEDYAAQNRPNPNDALDRDLDELTNPESESAIKWSEFEADSGETDTDILYKFEEYLPVSLRSWVDNKLRDLRIKLIENGILADPRTDDTQEAKAVTDAKSQLEAAQRELDDDVSALKSHEEDLIKDYGPDNVFRALKDKCIETDSGEYTYEHCFLSRTTQKSKTGGGDTNMGNFRHIEVVTVDEELPADGRGLGSGNRIMLKYENGQYCWNGPSRSTTVILACAEKDEIWKTVEEEKCVYRMEVGTPAVCGVVVRPPFEHSEL